MNPINEKRYSAFMDKLKDKTVYFTNTFEEAVIKSVPGEGFFVKFKGGEPFLAVKGSKIVTDGKLEYSEITEKEYDNF